LKIPLGAASSNRNTKGEEKKEKGPRRWARTFGPDSVGFRISNKVFEKRRGSKKRPSEVLKKKEKKSTLKTGTKP